MLLFTLSKILIYLFMIFCLLLYRRILTRSQTNCLKYFLIYLLTTLICLVTVMVNIRYLGILFILTEVLSVSFHLLASFNYTVKGYLIFRLLPKKKILFFSSILGLIGIFFFEIHLYLDYIFLDSIYWQYFSIFLNLLFSKPNIY